MPLRFFDTESILSDSDGWIDLIVRPLGDDVQRTKDIHALESEINALEDQIDEIENEVREVYRWR